MVVSYNMPEFIQNAKVKCCFIGIDMGKKNIGISFSDRSGKFAYPHSIIKNDVFKLSIIKSLCDELSVGSGVVGVPLSHFRNDNWIPTIENFAKKLSNILGISIFLQDESGTTYNNKDDISATVILQRALDIINNLYV
ncbi:MAG: putative Holliday junction resolvase [Candidatus Xenolissoclinum pacificiensis L6]|uniref:Holliday junction resolvase n=1 Tax=Candidatus Xenolissoclinum pacificiensis L6 TaxID=1401685 RepID=W2V100_9RICK|nr:MAG: putative Holliday junction resolvase [Candidatus Xenolissoclinum pacificiensis L6]